MRRVDHLIIGGGIAGVSAAEAIRNRDAAATIAIVGDESHLLYSRVLLPHVVRGKVSEEKAFLRTREFFIERNIECVIGVAATRLDAASRTVAFSDGSEIGYGKLLVATGGAVRRLDCPGAADAGCLYLQTLEDAAALKEAAKSGPALVIGGGFIALEFAMSFAHYGTPVVAVARGDGFFSRVLDDAGRRKLHAALAAHGVEVRPNAAVRAIEIVGGRKIAQLSTGERIECAAVGVGIGIVPNVGWLAASGIALSEGALVDDHLRASADVFAAGDVAEFMDARLGERRRVGNWQNALFQGKIAGANMAGGDAPYDAITSYSITCFDLPIAFVGAVDVRSDERVVRETAAGASLQFFLRENRVIGATCVGPFSDRAAVTALITSGAPLSALVP